MSAPQGPAQVVYARKSVPVIAQSQPPPSDVQPEQEVPSPEPQSQTPVPVNIGEERGNRDSQDDDEGQLTPLAPMQPQEPPKILSAVLSGKLDRSHYDSSHAGTGGVQHETIKSNAVVQNQDNVPVTGTPQSSLISAPPGQVIIGKRSVPLKKDKEEGFNHGMNSRPQPKGNGNAGIQLDHTAVAEQLFIRTKKEIARDKVHISCEKCGMEFNMLETYRFHIDRCIYAAKKPSTQGRKKSFVSTRKGSVSSGTMVVNAQAVHPPDNGLPPKKRGRGRPLKIAPAVVQNAISTIGNTSQSSTKASGKLHPKKGRKPSIVHVKPTAVNEVAKPAGGTEMAQPDGASEVAKPSTSTMIQNNENPIDESDTTMPEDIETSAARGLRTQRQRKAPKWYENMVMEYEVPHNVGRINARNKSPAQVSSKPAVSSPSSSQSKAAEALPEPKPGIKESDNEEALKPIKTEPLASEITATAMPTPPPRQQRVRKPPARIADGDVDVTLSPKVVVKLSPSPAPTEKEVAKTITSPRPHKEIGNKEKEESIVGSSTSTGISPRNTRRNMGASSTASPSSTSTPPTAKRSPNKIQRTSPTRAATRRFISAINSNDTEKEPPKHDQIPEKPTISETLKENDTELKIKETQEKGIEMPKTEEKEDRDVPPPVLQPQLPKLCPEHNVLVPENNSTASKETPKEQNTIIVKQENIEQMEEEIEDGKGKMDIDDVPPPVLRSITDTKDEGNVEPSSQPHLEEKVPPLRVSLQSIARSAPTVPTTRKRGSNLAIVPQNIVTSHSHQLPTETIPPPPPLKRLRRQSGGSGSEISADQITRSTPEIPDISKTNGFENGNSSQVNGYDQSKPSSFTGMPKLVSQSGFQSNDESDESTDDDELACPGAQASQGESKNLKPEIKDSVIRFMDKKISNRNMLRIREELMALKRKGNFWKLTKHAPLAAGFMDSMFCQTLEAIEPRNEPQ